MADNVSQQLLDMWKKQVEEGLAEADILIKGPGAAGKGWRSEPGQPGHSPVESLRSIFGRKQDGSEWD